MEKQLGIEIENDLERKQLLEDNCDVVVEVGYMKPYSPEQLQGHKENLADISITIAEIEAEMKQVSEDYKSKLKPLKEKRDDIIANIKARAEYVKEPCYRFTDQEAKLTGFYNNEGLLIECRPATADEIQPNLFRALRNGNVPPLTGTND